MAVLRSLFEPPSSTGFPLSEALVVGPPMGGACCLILSGCRSSFRAFHISNNFMLALIWLTDNILNFTNSDLIEILSLIFVPLRVLIKLFWMIWIALRAAHSGSSFVSLTLPSNWRPYLTLEVKSPSTNFNVDLKDRWLLNLLMMYILLFRAEPTEPIVL